MSDLSKLRALENLFDSAYDLGRPKTLYVVLSRDSDFIFTTTNPETAESKRKQQEEAEEMAGGRPSVYIKETILQ